MLFLHLRHPIHFYSELTDLPDPKTHRAHVFLSQLHYDALMHPKIPGFMHYINSTYRATGHISFFLDHITEDRPEMDRYRNIVLR